MAIIGREEGLKTLKTILGSSDPEFLALYGRRRVGKTFLVRHFFEKQKAIFFNVTGSKGAPLAEQIKNFTKEIGKTFYQNAPLSVGTTWDLTFEKLTNAFKTAPKNKKIVLFFDELPWMATPNSRLLQTLDYYWNHHWSRDTRIKLIICGSSASWIIENVVNNTGGLHNRLTRRICLEPFNLKESKQFLNSVGIKLTNDHLLQLYMVTGGIPYYLSKIEKGLSSSQNIEKLAFHPKGFLVNEFNNLFASLYDNHEAYIDMIRLIATRRYGIGQEDLLQKLGKSFQGKTGIKMLKSLEESHFIMSFKPHFHKKRGIYYKIIDEYTLFYLDWIEPIKETLLSRVSGYWEKQQTSPAWNSWAGYAFESVCYKHISQISHALHMSSSALPNTWRYSPRKGEEGAQIDLLFDRNDDCITLCEIKYTTYPYILDKQEAQKLHRKSAIFKERTQTKKQIFFALISAHGIKKTIYSEELVTGVAVLDDLFR